MDIPFNILWVDDDFDFIEENSFSIVDYLADNSLRCNVIKRNNISKDEKTNIENNYYDLLLVDYNLDNNNLFGTDIVKMVRSKAMLPDIIFYSSSDLERIRDKEIQRNRENDLLSLFQNGVYFSSAEKVNQLAIQVIDKIISRDAKINGFKGMVLSEVSKFESIVNRIIFSAINNAALDIGRTLDYIDNKIIDDMERTITENRTVIKNTGNNKETLLKLLHEDNRTFDHYKRTRIMLHILKSINIDGFKLTDYKEGVLSLRNSLGHVDNNTGERNTFIHNDNEITLTNDYCKKIRKTLIQWNETFNRILQEVDNARKGK